jgi:hypothetical protein
MFSSAARTIISRAAASAASHGAAVHRLNNNIQPSMMMAARFGSVSVFFTYLSFGILA